MPSAGGPSAAPGDRRVRRRPGENRRSLIAAGTVEFGLHGYAAAQTSTIAGRAGVSQPNVYANFSSKRELFLACLEELRSYAPGDDLSDELALLLYQAVAAVNDPSFGADLRTLLTELQAELGSHFDRALSRASELLLRT